MWRDGWQTFPGDPARKNASRNEPTGIEISQTFAFAVWVTICCSMEGGHEIGVPNGTAASHESITCAWPAATIRLQSGSGWQRRRSIAQTPRFPSPAISVNHPVVLRSKKL